MLSFWKLALNVEKGRPRETTNVCLNDLDRRFRFFLKMPVSFYFTDNVIIFILSVNLCYVSFVWIVIKYFRLIKINFYHIPKQECRLWFTFSHQSVTHRMSSILKFSGGKIRASAWRILRYDLLECWRYSSKLMFHAN